MSWLELSTRLGPRDLAVRLGPSSAWLCCQGKPITQNRSKALNLRTDKINFQKSFLFFHTITDLKNNCNAYESQIKCIWCYLYLGDYQSPQSLWQAGPPDIGGLGTFLSLHKMQSNSTVLGAGWPQMYPMLLTHSCGLSPHQLGVGCSPAQAGQ